MEKTLIFRRTEFVRDYYEVEWTENDYKDFLNYMSERTDDHSVIRYGILKNLSFDDICKILNNEQDDIRYELPYQTQTDHPFTSGEYIGDYLREMLREECWSNGVDDSECDDSNEELEIFEPAEEIYS